MFNIARYPFYSHLEGRIPTEAGMDFYRPIIIRLSALVILFLVIRKEGYLLIIGLDLFWRVAHVLACVRYLVLIVRKEGNSLNLGSDSV